jgi:hypothetical protein
MKGDRELLYFLSRPKEARRAYKQRVNNAWLVGAAVLRKLRVSANSLCVVTLF